MPPGARLPHRTTKIVPAPAGQVCPSVRTASSGQARPARFARTASRDPARPRRRRRRCAPRGLRRRRGRPGDVWVTRDEGKRCSSKRRARGRDRDAGARPVGRRSTPATAAGSSRRSTVFGLGLESPRLVLLRERDRGDARRSRLPPARRRRRVVGLPRLGSRRTERPGRRRGVPRAVRARVRREGAACVRRSGAAAAVRSVVRSCMRARGEAPNGANVLRTPRGRRASRRGCCAAPCASRLRAIRVCADNPCLYPHRYRCDEADRRRDPALRRRGDGARRHAPLGGRRAPVATPRVVCLRAGRRATPYLWGTLWSAGFVFVLWPLFQSRGYHVLWSGPSIPVLGPLDVTTEELRGAALECASARRGRARVRGVCAPPRSRPAARRGDRTSLGARLRRSPRGSCRRSSATRADWSRRCAAVGSRRGAARPRGAALAARRGIARARLQPRGGDGGARVRPPGRTRVPRRPGARATTRPLRRSGARRRGDRCGSSAVTGSRSLIRTLPALETCRSRSSPARSCCCSAPPARASRRSCARSPASCRGSTAAGSRDASRWPAATRGARGRRSSRERSQRSSRIPRTRSSSGASRRRSRSGSRTSAPRRRRFCRESRRHSRQSASAGSAHGA